MIDQDKQPSASSDPDRRSFGCGTMIFSSIIAPVFAHFLVGAVFGRDRVSTASLWGLAPVAHVLFFIACLPILWLAHGAALFAWRRLAYPPESPILWAAVTAMIMYLFLVTVFWWLRGGQKIPLGV
jgi:hypothetical protein